MPQPSPRLRPLRADDAPAVLAAFSAAPDMARQGTVTTPAEATAYVSRLTGDPRHHVLALTLEDHLVGLVGVTADDPNRTGWFWYWLHAAHRGHGWMSAAAATVADWALDAGGLERLELGHRVDNPASARVAQAAGFVPEGRERGKFLIDGERVDVLTYGRLPSDPAPTGPRLPLTTVGHPRAETHEGATAGPAPTVQVAVQVPAELTREEVLDLYDAVGWTAYTREPGTLLTGLAASHRIVTAREDGTLVGLARSVSDGATIVYVQDVLVRPRTQRGGVGARLVTALLDQYVGVRQQVLLTDAEPGQRAFYESLGFTEVHDLDPGQRAFVR